MSTLAAKAFIETAEAPTFACFIEPLADSMELPEIHYSADERYLIVHDPFDGFLYRLDLPIPSNVTTNTLRVLGCVSESENPPLVLLPDWKVVQLLDWTVSLEKFKCIGQLPPIKNTVPPVLLELFDGRLVALHYEQIVVMDVITGAIMSRISLAEEARIRACNVRMIEGRICAEWIVDEGCRYGSDSRMIYRLADCLTTERLFEYQFPAEANYSWPMNQYSLTWGVNVPSKGMVWYPRNSLGEPINKLIVEPFECSHDVRWADSNNTFCIRYADKLEFYQDVCKVAQIPLRGQPPRVLPFDDRRTAVALYESVLDEECIRVAGLFDYKVMKLLCWCRGHAMGMRTKTSPSSRFLTTIYAKLPTPCPGYSNGTVVITDFQNYLEK